MLLESRPIHQAKRKLLPVFNARLVERVDIIELSGVSRDVLGKHDQATHRGLVHTINVDNFQGSLRGACCCSQSGSGTP